MPSDVTTRRASTADLPAILDVARGALGWTDADTSFLSWKHVQNSYGESPMWVAECDGRLVGFRTFLRWELVGPDGHVHRAVRAVDTATDPAYQGRGIFRRLTLEAIDELAAEGVEMIFNTPNEKSLAGYLTMGWHEIGRLAVVASPNRWRFALAVAGARQPAAREAVSSDIGEPAGVALGDAAAIDALLVTQPARGGITTHRTSAHLAWRYGHPPLGYRVVHTGSLADGLAVFRLRQRGSAVEAVVCDVIAPGHDAARSRVLVGLIRGERAADYLIRLGADGVDARAFLPVPRIGPVLACRPLDGSAPPALDEWRLTMGDVELL